MTPEEKAAFAEKMKKAREVKKGAPVDVHDDVDGPGDIPPAAPCTLWTMNLLTDSML